MSQVVSPHLDPTTPASSSQSTKSSSQQSPAKATYETEAQWQYRSKFLTHYHGQYPQEQLECWSKILSNSKFYGCQYNQDVMQKLNQMLAEMGEEMIQPRTG